jgi:hypothetical protein
VKVAEEVDAGRTKLGRREALALARGVDRVVAARGARIVDYDLRKDRPSDDELLAVLLGPTGNLRAPTFRVGATLVVGFSETVYAELF